MRELERLDCELSLARVELRDFPLAGPAIDERPRLLRGARGVEKLDAAVGALAVAGDPLVTPFQQLGTLGKPLFKHEVRPLGSATKPEGRVVGATGSDINYFGLVAQAADALEEELVDPKRIDV